MKNTIITFMIKELDKLSHELRILHYGKKSPKPEEEIEKKRWQKKWNLFYNFLLTYRAIYQQMLDSADESNRNINILSEKLDPDPTSNQSNNEYLLLNTPVKKCILNYFSMIQYINRSGKLFVKEIENENIELTELLLLDEVYFFRNKAIEHSIDYKDSNPYPRGTNSNFSSKIQIPFFYGQFFECGGCCLESDFKNNYGIELHLTPDMNNKDYSDLIYSALKKLDKKLRIWNEKEQTGIPNSLVIHLFEYRFPLPITNIEDYTLNVINLIKSYYKIK